MLISILYLLLYIAVAVIVLEVIFWILSLIFAGWLLTPRIRGLAYAILLIFVLIYALQYLQFV